MSIGSKMRALAVSRRFHGLFEITVAIPWAYPGFRFGLHIAASAAALPQDFVERPAAMAAGIAINLLVLAILNGWCDR